MEEALDMSLDDLIKRNRQLGRENDGNFRGKGRNFRATGSGSVRGRFRSDVSGGRLTRRTPVGGQFRAAPYSFNPLGFRVGQKAMVGEGSNHDAETRLYVSNLDYGVSNDDIKVLFSDVGELAGCAIHYDKKGKPQGTAEVVYKKYSDAVAAIKRFDDVHLDGRPIKIELVGANVVTSAVFPGPGVVPSAVFPANDGTLGFGGVAVIRSNSWNGAKRGQASGAKRARAP